MGVLYFLFRFLCRCEMKMMVVGERVAMSENVVNLCVLVVTNV